MDPPLLLGESSRQFGARSDAELAVDATEIRFDATHAQVQGPCRFPVRESGRHQVGHFLLGWRQADRAGSPAPIRAISPLAFVAQRRAPSSSKISNARPRESRAS